MTIRHLDDLAVGAAMFALCIGAGMWLSREGDYAALIVLGVIGLVFLLYFLYIGTKTETISADGICTKSILKTQWIPWKKVDKVGIAYLNLGGWPSYYLCVAGEKNGLLLLRYREELKTVIESFYGPLDYDQKTNAEE